MAGTIVKRCVKGQRRCRVTNRCVTKRKIIRKLAKCNRGTRKCADQVCYKYIPIKHNYY